MNNSNRINLGLAILRISFAVLLLTHGIPKAQLLFSGGEINFPDPLSIGATFSLILAVIGEVVCPILLIIGFKVRWAAIPPAIVMLVATLIVHADDPFRKKEFAMVYLFAFITMALLGAGKWSLDAMRGKKA
ncbi:DoxX family membrane protein [Leptobacterium flavescens]|uniref:DoxX family membrane protein n=1 Tax=Leptobacterium flavescens TaxID=472055 RepID=A0A6P0UK85_9FLAO|nr:DoxX family protein [Leptobacterium flavescens]NER13377.1 DoxX family membrane protein [Leptobacterium flavescens]